VLVATDFVLARIRKTTSLWPGVKYWISDLSQSGEIKKTKGYTENTHYIEFFNENSVNEYAFVSESCISPLEETNFPAKPSKKFITAMEATKKECLLMDKIASDLKSSVLDVLHQTNLGKDWIGIRIRAETYVVPGKEQQQLLSKKTKSSFSLNNEVTQIETANCFGYVLKYCGNIDQHFAVFDEIQLQPKWVSVEKGVSDIDIFPERVEETLYAEPQDFQKFCLLCHLAPSPTDLVLKCVTCKSICHESCTPPNEEFLAIHELRVKPFKWKCWNCKGTSVAFNEFSVFYHFVVFSLS
jgi:hypothetical protein